MYPLHLKFAAYGSSGSGKSSLIEIVEKIASNITVHRKDTTRKPRPNENPDKSLDLRFLSQKDFDTNTRSGEYDLVYEKYGGLYGVRRDQLIKAFENKEIHFAIVRDISAIQQFKFMYRDAVALYIHADPETIPENLRKREGVNFEERLRRIQMEYKEFIENNTLFDHVVLNFWELDNSVRQLRNILHSYVRKSTSYLK